MHPQLIYSDHFYESNTSGSLQSAKQIIPKVMTFIHPKSIVDVGCGLGSWLSIFKENGITDILGIDGEWVNEDLLLISKNEFLKKNLTKKINLTRRFDLAISLEVAEHIPKQYSQHFIRELTQLSDIILFSAAIPYQGGVHHINLNWPSYWASIFKKFDYYPIDYLRKKIWNNKNIEIHYIQNILFFCKKSKIQANSILLEEYLRNRGNPISIVHPQMYLKKAQVSEVLYSLSKLLPTQFKQIVKKFIFRKKK